jgi:uncharacterized surface anchored protein
MELKATSQLETIIADAHQNFNNGSISYALIRIDQMVDGEVKPNTTRLFLEITNSNMGISTSSRVQVFSTTLPILQHFAFDIQKLVGQIDPAWLSTIEADITLNKAVAEPLHLRYGVVGKNVLSLPVREAVEAQSNADHEHQAPVYTGRTQEPVTFGRKRMDEGFDPDDVMA